MPGDAEKGSGPTAQALRDFLADNPWGDTFPVTHSGWLLLAESSKEYGFGQRIGKVGIGPIVTLTRDGGRYRPSQLGGCGTVVPAPGEQSAVIDAVRVRGDELTITWMNGSCGLGGPPDQALVRVETVQADTAVHLLVITKRNPAAVSASSACAGVGLSSTAMTTLAAPLGARSAFDDAHIPAASITVG
ncbi:MAG: hypothetical protein M3Y77_03030 [Actinomycetota bacterium]|nr:hypothetical protein [Actinomycetota bacterium]